MTENAPPGNGKGLISYADKAHHLKPRRQAKVTTEEVSAGTAPVNALGGIGGEK